MFIKLRSDFPFLKTKIDSKPIAFLDNAATSQKPYPVLEALTTFYEKYSAPVHRGIYTSAEAATQLYEDARTTLAQFINAERSEIVFTSGTTSGINGIARSWALNKLTKLDEIVLTELEHHANLIPWQEVCQKTGAQLRFIPIIPDGNLDYSSLDRIINTKTKLVAVTHCSNAIGTLVDVKRIINQARAVGARTLIDAAQTAPHQKINVKELDCDFLAFSGHKMLGPTGIGVLYIAKRLQEEVLPLNYGGGMVSNVSYYNASWAAAPHKFEGGTPPIAQAVGLATAVEYLQKHINFDEFQKYEAALCANLIEELKKIKGMRVLGPEEQLKATGHLVSFTLQGVHAHDIAAYADTCGISVRAGNHCAQPLLKKLGIEASVRVSFYLYSGHDDVERFINCLKAL